MSSDGDDRFGEGDDPPAKGTYEVGYGKPPAEHRFKKGQSGNPRGRPCKPKFGADFDSLSAGLLSARGILLEEAYRPVTVREGDQTVKMPAIRAIMRSQIRLAAKGNRFASRGIIEYVRDIETELHRRRLENLKAMIEYKIYWEREIEEARRFGRPEPQTFPHPDDIYLDFPEGRACVCGPMTKEDTAAWSRLLEDRDELQDRVSTFAAQYEKTRSAEKKIDALESWKAAQEHFDCVNDDLPKRYRKDLADRCWLEGASLPGSKRTLQWPGEEF